MSININTGMYRLVFQNFGGALEYCDAPFASKQMAEAFQAYYNSITDVGKCVVVYQIGSVTFTDMQRENYMNLKIMYDTTKRTKQNIKIPFLDYSITQTKLDNLLMHLNDFKGISSVGGKRMILQQKPTRFSED